MVDRPAVLLVSNEQDIGCDLVVRSLRDSGAPYARLNTERLPSYRVSWGAEEFTLSTDRRNLDLVGLVGIWLRRPEWPAFPGTTTAETLVLQQQWRALVRGLEVTSARWMNGVAAGQTAENKIVQLRAARAAGLRVPPTLVSNDAETIRRFAAEQGPVVFKALDGPLVEDDEGGRFVFTRRSDLALLDGLRQPEPVPLIVQKEIAGKTDLRVLVVDSHVLAFEVVGADPGSVDWRSGGAATAVRTAEIPPALTKACKLLVRGLDLRFGAIDFVRQGEEHFFLECNQNGEWGWLQAATGERVADVVASALLGST